MKLIERHIRPLFDEYMDSFGDTIYSKKINKKGDMG